MGRGGERNLTTHTRQLTIGLGRMVGGGFVVFLILTLLVRIDASRGPVDGAMVWSAAGGAAAVCVVLTIVLWGSALRRIAAGPWAGVSGALIALGAIGGGFVGYWAGCELGGMLGWGDRVCWLGVCVGGVIAARIAVAGLGMSGRRGRWLTQ